MTAAADVTSIMTWQPTTSPSQLSPHAFSLTAWETQSDNEHNSACPVWNTQILTNEKRKLTLSGLRALEPQPHFQSRPHTLEFSPLYFVKNASFARKGSVPKPSKPNSKLESKSSSSVSRRWELAAVMISLSSNRSKGGHEAPNMPAPSCSPPPFLSTGESDPPFLSTGDFSPSGQREGFCPRRQV